VPPQLLHNDGDLDTQFMLEWWAAHINRVTAEAERAGPIVPISVLVLPRGKRENYVPNDRAIAGYDEVCAWAAQRGGATLLADDVTDWRVQIRAILGARVIVTDYGSSSLMNGSLARNATLIVLGQQHPMAAVTALVDWQARARGNRVHYVPTLAAVPALYDQLMAT